MLRNYAKRIPEFSKELLKKADEAKKENGTHFVHMSEEKYLDVLKQFENVLNLIEKQLKSKQKGMKL